jgi:hypothetical protein
MLLLSIIALALLGPGAHVEPVAGPPRPAAREASWVRFHVRDFPEGRLTYFYDASTVRKVGDSVTARWKVIGTRAASTTLYSIEIACRAATFTEKGTVYVDADGIARKLPTSQLWVNRPIEPGTSGDAFRNRFCR